MNRHPNHSNVYRLDLPDCGDADRNPPTAQSSSETTANNGLRALRSVPMQPSMPVPAHDAGSTVETPPLVEVTNLTLRRDEVLGERLGEVVGLTCKDGVIALTISLSSDAPADTRWCKQLTCCIDTGSKRFGAPILSVEPSECGKFVHLRTHPMPASTRPTSSAVSENAVVRLANPRSWKLEAKLSELARYLIAP